MKLEWGLDNNMCKTTEVFILSGRYNFLFIPSWQLHIHIWRWGRWCAVLDLFGVDSEDIRKIAVEAVLVSLLLTLGVFRTLFWCLCCWI